jgi:hypothetical protein
MKNTSRKGMQERRGKREERSREIKRGKKNGRQPEKDDGTTV